MSKAPYSSMQGESLVIVLTSFAVAAAGPLSTNVVPSRLEASVIGGNLSHTTLIQL